MKKEIMDDFNVKKYEEKLLDECKEKRIPAMGYIELTPLCNFNCIMCYVHLTTTQMKKHGKMMSKEQVIRVVQEAAEMGLYTVSITGGEIFTRSDFREIYEAIYDMGIIISLRTNAYAINDDIIEWLKARPPRDIHVTLYGGNNETYEKVCGVKNGYDIVTANIDKIIDAKIQVCLTYTVIQHNKDEFEIMEKWAKRRGIVLERYAEIIKPDKRTERKAEDLRIEHIKLPFEVPDNAVVPREKQIIDINRPFRVCRNYGCQFTLKWNGMLGICVTMKSVDVDVTDKPFAEAYRLLYENTEKIKYPEKCLTCKYIDFCDACPSRLEAETGDPEGISEYICENAKWEHDMCWCELQKQEAKKNEGKE